MIINPSFQTWLSNYFGSADFVVSPLAGDASFRLYFRVKHAGKTFIAMDASAEKEKCSQFIAIADALRAKQLLSPEIYAKDLSSGYLLLTDFGDNQLLTTINSENRMELYSKALDALAVLSTCKTIEVYSVPSFTQQFMRDEMDWFCEWFLEKYLEIKLTPAQKSMLASSFDVLVKECASQPQVFMHRDYHSANLMVLPEHKMGILDFQDAFMGPITYDLVSLLRDCYIEVPKDLVVALVNQYREALNLSVSEAEFIRWFDWMGIQRHLKALLTFSRKYCRDNNSNYLRYIPRTLNYVLYESSIYHEFSELHAFLNDVVIERIAVVNN